MAQLRGFGWLVSRKLEFARLCPSHRAISRDPITVLLFFFCAVGRGKILRVALSGLFGKGQLKAVCDKRQHLILLRLYAGGHSYSVFFSGTKYFIYAVECY